ncbi:MAG: GTP cyclohydrolase I FolE [Actinomycetota bacterium]|nr:GTP cyclohydrolase I FolE [Actinomycetota bacterium]
MDLGAIADAVRTILKAVGEDPERPGLQGTPERVARFYQEVFSGLHQDPREVLTVVAGEGDEDREQPRGMVILRDIPFSSLCEHHLTAMVGRAHVGYLPQEGRLTGLSKLARLVEAYARRPQVQERLTAQVADALMEVLEPRGAVVVVEAEHLCMSMRGVRKPGATTMTSEVRGELAEDPALRAEAMSLMRG